MSITWVQDLLALYASPEALRLHATFFFTIDVRFHRKSTNEWSKYLTLKPDFRKKTHLSYEPDNPKITLQEYYSQAGALKATPTLRATYAVKTAVKFHIE